VTSIITAAAFALAWFGFRYERHRRWRADVEAALGVLRAVHHGMVTGLTPGQAVGWGQLYFSTIYTEAVALRRAQETWEAVMGGNMDQVFVVPTAPLARLATTSPHEGLIETRTVAVANFALWRAEVFNQLAGQLTDFNAVHAPEIMDATTTPARRETLAATASAISHTLHRDGIGEAWAAGAHGADGWYRALVTEVTQNTQKLIDLRSGARWHWLREWPYVIVDSLALAGVIAVTITVTLRLF